MVIVDATEMWTDTGIWVEAGDLITLDADGTIQLSADANDVSSPDGVQSGRRAVNAPLRGRPPVKRDGATTAGIPNKHCVNRA